MFLCSQTNLWPQFTPAKNEDNISTCLLLRRTLSWHKNDLEAPSRGSWRMWSLWACSGVPSRWWPGECGGCVYACRAVFVCCFRCSCFFFFQWCNITVCEKLCEKLLFLDGGCVWWLWKVFFLVWLSKWQKTITHKVKKSFDLYLTWAKLPTCSLISYNRMITNHNDQLLLCFDSKWHQTV